VIHAVLTGGDALSGGCFQKSKGSVRVRDHSFPRQVRHGPIFSIVTRDECRRTACGCPVVTCGYASSTSEVSGQPGSTGSGSIGDVVRLDAAAGAPDEERARTRAGGGRKRCRRITKKLLSERAPVAGCSRPQSSAAMLLRSTGDDRTAAGCSAALAPGDNAED
jgi:hypothetical protein